MADKTQKNSVQREPYQAEDSSDAPCFIPREEEGEMRKRNEG